MRKCSNPPNLYSSPPCPKAIGLTIVFTRTSRHFFSGALCFTSLLNYLFKSIKLVILWTFSPNVMCMEH